MNYFCATFHVAEEKAELLVAFLGDQGFEMFEEETGTLKAYVPVAAASEAEIRSGIETIDQEFTGTGWSLELIPDQNWNAVWESSFSPVIIANRVSIRAPFHPAPSANLMDLVIEPKMSFGTGHHPTTSLMIQAMLDINWTNTNVLDMGCGSGVLAIVAEKLGANAVLAIDIDDWAVENSQENCERNNCNQIQTLKGNSSLISEKKFSHILANINRNILLHDMHAYVDSLVNGGVLFMSGFLSQDKTVITAKAQELGISPHQSLEQDNWMMLSFVKTTQ